MKKIFAIIVMVMSLMGQVVAQMDTVQWKCNRYHYSLWYDTLPEFFSTLPGYDNIPELHVTSWSCDLRWKMLSIPQHVDRPTLVYGVAVTQENLFSSSFNSIIHNHWYLPEYVYLFQAVGDTVVLRDSVRWDTIAPKVMKIAVNADTDRYGFEYVRVYEAMFKDPILVDSVFYAVSSNYGGNAPRSSWHYEYEYYPVLPMDVFFRDGLVEGDPRCAKPSWWQAKIWDMNTRQFYNDTRVFNSPLFGMYFPIVDYVELIVTTSDTAMGTAGPVAHVARNTTQTIWARPKRGYRFSHWVEDWGIQATRSVYIVQDTTRYTAVFEPKERYSVRGESDEEGAGYVTLDDSVYYEGDTAVLEAVASEGMKFRYWSTGSAENPLRIVVESDTVVTAHFTELEVYRVRGESSDEAKGYVEVDDSVHREDDTARLEAYAEAGYVFSRWSTGSEENPLLIVVESDTVVTAFFAGTGIGIRSEEEWKAGFGLTPNPARGSVTATLAEAAGGGTVLRVQDVAGREVLRKELEAGTRSCTFSVSELPAGSYFVTLTTKDDTGTRKLVVE